MTPDHAVQVLQSAAFLHAYTKLYKKQTVDVGDYY
jgi:hypothetical protein